MSEAYSADAILAIHAEVVFRVANTTGQVQLAQGCWRWARVLLKPAKKHRFAGHLDRRVVKGNRRPKMRLVGRLMGKVSVLTIPAKLDQLATSGVEQREWLDTR